MNEKFTFEPHPNGTLIRCGNLWRIARTPDQIPKKIKLLERDLELLSEKKYITRTGETFPSPV
jgi:hypothetical protein